MLFVNKFPSKPYMAHSSFRLPDNSHIDFLIKLRSVKLLIAMEEFGVSEPECPAQAHLSERERGSVGRPSLGADFGNRFSSRSKAAFISCATSIFPPVSG